VIKIGHDISKIDRFEPLLLREALLRRMFGEDELNQSLGMGAARLRFLAGSWVAKESLSKALGWGLFDWDLSLAQFVRPSARGARIWLFSPTLSAQLHAFQIQTSVSYEENLASAVTIIFDL
jgi:holo-[acyl-carrier protein] synthase